MDTTEYKGYTITIEQDEWAGNDSPLEWTTPEERGATFVLYHRQYNLPNELDVDFDEYDGWDELAKANVPDGQPVYRFVRWYEHSGIVVSLSDTSDVGGWDSGCAGVVYGETEEAIEGVFSTWKQYAEGDIWQYLIEDEHGDTIDSLCGLYGYDYAVEQAKYFIDHEYTPPRASVYAISASKVHG